MKDVATFLLTVTITCLGCTPEPVAPSQHVTATVPEQQPRPLGPSTHEGDTEYQNGLTSMLSTAAPLLGVNVVTSCYRLGYSSGIQEATLFQASLDHHLSETGCLAGAQIAGKVVGFVRAPGTPLCPGYRHPELEGYGPQGKLFSKDRLAVAQEAAKYVRGANDVDINVTVFTVGYNMGFGHQWESVDQEAQAEKLTHDGCELALRTDPPPSPDQASLISSMCAEEARSARNSESTRNMKCLMASREMNGELSGHSVKPGCTSK